MEMKIVIPCLLLLQIAVYLTERFWLKDKYSKYRFIAQLCSWIGLGVWAICRGTLADFISFSLPWICLILPVSYLLYLLSLWIVGTQMSSQNLWPIESFHLKGKLGRLFTLESRHNLLSSTYEELLYRWFLQNAIYELFDSAVISIALTSLLFFIVHVNKKIAIVQMADILLFSIVITIFYQWSINPIYCIIIHIARNQLIISQKYVQAYNDQHKSAKYMRILQNRKG